MVGEWYNREGRRISTSEANALLGDFDYKVVARTEVGPYVVSTVWLGLDHSYRDEGPPLIFETMVFTASALSEENMDKPMFIEGEYEQLPPIIGLPEGLKIPKRNPDRESLIEFDCERYATEDEAVTGHRQMVELIQATLITDEELLGEIEVPHED